jgi:hypothetical protein
MTNQKSAGPKAAMVGAAAALAAVMAMPVVTAAQDDTMDDTAKVRVGHFSPDAPAVDVYAGEDAILTDVAFGDLSPYLEVPGGTYSIAVVAAGADPADGAVIGPVDLDFAAGTMTTVAATNVLESIEAQVLADEPMPQDGIAQVRVVHFSADAPAVDIALDEGDVVVENLAYPNATEAYLDLPEGEYDLEIRPTGTTDVAFDIDPLDLPGGTSFTVFAIGSLADGSFTVLPAVDASLAEVRVGHFSPDAPAVDVYANGDAILTDVAFGDLSPSLAVPAGTYRIQVVAAGGDPADGTVIDAELTFDGNTKTTVAATNELAEITPVVINDKVVQPRAEGAKVRVVHLSANAPKVDIAPDGSKRNAAIFKNLGFGQAKGYKNVPAGEVDLDIRAAGERAKAFDIPPFTVEDGKAYSAIAIGQFPDSFDVILVEEASR